MLWLSCISTGKICYQNHWQFCNVKNPTLLALATLGDKTQIEMILLVLYHPRWPRQVRQAFFRCKTANSFVNKFCQCA